MTRTQYARLRSAYRRPGNRVCVDPGNPYVSIGYRPAIYQTVYPERLAMSVDQLDLIERTFPLRAEPFQPYRWLTKPQCRTPNNARLGFWRALALSKARAAIRAYEKEQAHVRTV